MRPFLISVLLLAAVCEATPLRAQTGGQTCQVPDPCILNPNGPKCIGDWATP